MGSACNYSLCRYKKLKINILLSIDNTTKKIRLEAQEKRFRTKIELAYELVDDTEARGISDIGILHS
jgi:hypothetical protein